MTRQVMRNHYNRKLDAVFEYMEENVTWIGPLDFQWANSAKQMKKILAPEYEVPCIMTDEEYALAATNKNMWITYGKYTLFANHENNSFIQLKYRFTFVWEKRGDIFEIVHLHVSQAYDYPRGIQEPYKQGQNPFRYMASFIQSTMNQEKLSFKDIKGRFHYLRKNEVIYYCSR